MNSLTLKIFSDRCSLKWHKEEQEDYLLNSLIYLVALDNLSEEEQEGGDIIFLKIYLKVQWEEALHLPLQLWDQEVQEYLIPQAEVEGGKDMKIMKILTMVMNIIIKDKEVIQQFKYNLLMKL